MQKRFEMPKKQKKTSGGSRKASRRKAKSPRKSRRKQKRKVYAPRRSTTGILRNLAQMISKQRLRGL